MDRKQTIDHLIKVNNGKWVRFDSSVIDTLNTAMLDTDPVRMRVFVRNRNFVYSLDEWNNRVAELGFEIQCIKGGI